MKHRFRPARVICLALVLGAAAGGCRRAWRGGAEKPIEVLVSGDPETLDPRYSTDAVGLRATRLVHAGLMRLDPDTLEPRPYAARSWRWRDELTLEVTLRDDVRFHSGKPLDAGDVVATLHAFASPAVASRHARMVETVADAHAEGEHVVIVRLSRPHGTLLTDLELPILRADQAESPPAPEGSLDGLGPYSVDRFARGDLLLAPATGGVLPRPAHALELRTVHDENARALRLESGAADVAVNLVSPTLLPALAAAPGLAVVSRPGANLTYVVVNEERAGLDDADVRQGLSLAIDRALICRTLFDGHAQPASGLIAPASWAHHDAPALEHDPERAARLLGTAGVHPLRLTVLTSTERLRGDIARFVAQELHDLGVEAEVIPLELGTMIARLNAGDFDLAFLQLPEMSEPNVLRYFLQSSFVPPAGGNRGRVRDADLDALLDAGDSTMDPTARRGIYARVEAHNRLRMHWIPLWYEDQVAVVSVRAHTFLPSAENRWLGLASLP
jgi:peptide/nickel transport system substrate-binding protein